MWRYPARHGAGPAHAQSAGANGGLSVYSTYLGKWIGNPRSYVADRGLARVHILLCVYRPFLGLSLDLFNKTGQRHDPRGVERERERD